MRWEHQTIKQDGYSKVCSVWRLYAPNETTWVARVWQPYKGSLWRMYLLDENGYATPESCRTLKEAKQIAEAYLVMKELDR